ncbi:hypothetical protein Peur_014884 [Populus x canadensis]
MAWTWKIRARLISDQNNQPRLLASEIEKSIHKKNIFFITISAFKKSIQVAFCLCSGNIHRLRGKSKLINNNQMQV